MDVLWLLIILSSTSILARVRSFFFLETHIFEFLFIISTNSGEEMMVELTRRLSFSD